MLSRLPARVRATLPWILALVPFVALLAWFWTSGDGTTMDDNGLYLMHAEALFEGRPYTQTNYLDTRYHDSPSVQPPGLPLTLAAVMALTGGYNVVAIKLVMILSALPFIVLPGLYFGRTHGVAIGAAISIFLGVGQAWMSMRVLADLGFASLVWALIWVLDRTDAFRWSHVIAVFALGSAAMAHRYLGVAVVPTVALFALLNHRRLGLRLAVPPVFWVVGGVVGLTITGLWRPIIAEIGWGNPGFAGYLAGRLRTSFLLPAAESHLHLFSWNPANDAFHIASLSIAAVALVAWTRRNWRSAGWLFAVCYLGALASSWAQASRYLIPLYPFLLFGLFAGLRAAIGWLRTDLSSAARSGFTLGIAGIIAMLGTIDILRQQRPVDLWGDPDTRELVLYLRQVRALDNEVRVMAPRPRVLAWETGIPTALTILRPADETLIELERLGITHVVMGLPQVGIDATRTVTELREEFPCRFEMAFRNRSYTVHHLIPECTP